MQALEESETRVPDKKGTRNPFKLLLGHRTRKKIFRERKLLQREETMKEDLERFLMEMEDRSAWVTFQLNNMNYVRMKKREMIARIERKEKEREEKAILESMRENGLSFFKGAIKDYKKWQNSGAKHLEFTGHEGSVSSCKLSQCNGYLFSCSEDKTAMLWDLETGQCIKTYIGHTKIVNDCDIHSNFERYSRNLCLLTCSGDGTLRLWNGIDTNAQVIIRGHTQAIYRCSFSPNGNSIVSCSEDKTIRTWMYPEGYLLYIYTGHVSPVTTVRFSPTGKFLVSGSDYGERKILVWNAKMPVLDDPKQFPHYIFWTPAGLIRKILINHGIPKPSFWLQKNQMSAISDDRMLDYWEGEIDDPELEDYPSESEEEDSSGSDSDGSSSEEDGVGIEGMEMNNADTNTISQKDEGNSSSSKKRSKKNKKEPDKEKPVDEFIKQDIRQCNGITLSAVVINTAGEQIEAVEYNPGGCVFVCLQSNEPVAEIFFDVISKDTRFDMFSTQSGQRLGYFHPEGVIPWRPEEEIPAKLFGSKKPTRVIPSGFVKSKENSGLIYNENIRLKNEIMTNIINTNIEIMWCCPEAELGAVVVTANVRMRDSNTWQQLSYSLKESAIRVSEKKGKPAENADSVASDGRVSVRYDFDQTERHRMLWEFVRDKDWKAVATFFEKKAVAYNRNELIRRKYRILNLLAEMFESADWLILHTPVIYTAGITKSVTLCDTDYYDPAATDSEHKALYGLRGDVDSPTSATGNEGKDEREEEENEVENEEVEGEAEPALEEDSEKEAGEEHGTAAAETVGEDAPEHSGSASGDLSMASNDAALSVPVPSSQSAAEAEEEGGSAHPEVTAPDVTDATTTDAAITKKPLKSNIRSGATATTASSISAKFFGLSGGVTEKRPAKTVKFSRVLAAGSSDEAAPAGAAPSGIKRDGKPSLKEEEGKATTATTTAAPLRSRGIVRIPPKPTTTTTTDPDEDLSLLPGRRREDDQMGFEQVADTEEEDSSEDSAANRGGINRPVASDLKLPKIVFTEDVESEAFTAEVTKLVKQETESILSMQKAQIAIEQEIRSYTVSEETRLMWKNLSEAPKWLHSDKLLYLEKQKNELIQKIKVKHTNNIAIQDEVDFTSIKTPEYHLIKSGKFGPEIDEFTMLLPPTFPLRAGQSKYALQPVLTQYEKILSKLKIQALPSTIEEAKDPTVRDHMNKLYNRMLHTEERQYRVHMEESVEADVVLAVLTERTYFSSRRESFLTLPGMSPHYPNPNYPVPAQLLPGVRFQRPAENRHLTAYEMLFGKKIIKSKFALPVGRRPSPEQLQVHTERLLSADDPILLAKSIRIVGEGDDSSGSEDEQQLQGVQGEYASSSQKSTADGALSEEPSAAPTSSFKFGSRARRSKKKKSSRTANPMFLRPGMVPADVYLGRRGCYPVAPGLKEYIDSLRDETVKNVSAAVAQVREDNRRDTSTAYAKSMKAELLSRKDESERSKMRDDLLREMERLERVRKAEIKKGLLTRFKINGFELAHHGSVNDAVFAPTEGRIATAGGDALVKLWDPRDGSFVRSLKGHSSEVFSVRYSSTEQFLVSAGADAEILIWSMLTQTLNRRLLGHVDCIYGLSTSDDFSLIVSASHDGTIKTWRTTPRHPDAPAAPRILAVTDTTALLSWVSPPCFNLDVNAFHIQWRVGAAREQWVPAQGLSVPPHYRTKMVKGLIAATGYQFRICAENRLGRGNWSPPSRLTQLEFGLPEQFETPRVCQVKQRSIMVGWFAGNPTTFGAASRTFQVQVSGGGKSFEQNTMLEISLEDGVSLGKVMLRAFHRLYESYLNTKDALRKSQGFSIHRSKAAAVVHDEDTEEQLPEIADGFSIEDIQHVLERRQDTTMLFVVAEYVNLKPGFNYLFRTRGMNVAGLGPWSVPTYSTFTLPTVPATPHRPHIAHATLRSILFQWDPPDTGGSAITGYSIILKNSDRHINLPRSAVNYLWEGLFPGRSYYLKVQAHNEVGASEYSEWNLPSQSHTMTGPPELPPNPRAIAGTWDRITLETRLSYNNGSFITAMEVEQRFIDPFQIGEWEHPIGLFTYKIPEDVEIVEAVDYEQQQVDIEEMVAKLETLKSASGFNPYSNDAHKIDKEIEELIEKQKPYGSLIRFEVSSLVQNRLYEFRVRFLNEAGRSDWSQPSHRAKTNKAQLPGVCELPAITTLAVDFVTLMVSVPSAGGAAIKMFTVEIIDLDENDTRIVKHSRNASDRERSIMIRIPNLKPGGSFIFRVRAESEVGCGPFSEWTKEIKLNMPELDAKSTAAAVIARVRK